MVPRKLLAIGVKSNHCSSVEDHFTPVEYVWYGIQPRVLIRHYFLKTSALLTVTVNGDRYREIKNTYIFTLNGSVGSRRHVVIDEPHGTRHNGNIETNFLR